TCAMEQPQLREFPAKHSMLSRRLLVWSTLCYVGARLEPPMTLGGLLVDVIVVAAVFQIDASGDDASRNADDDARRSEPLHAVLADRPEIVSILRTARKAT